MFDFCQHADHDMFAMVADTVLMLDVEKWIRGLPVFGNTEPDPFSMRIGPPGDVNIVFDRYTMTKDGFVMKKDLARYKIEKRMEEFRELSKQGKLYVAKSEVNGK